MSDTTLSATITAGFSGLNTAFAGARNAVKEGCDGIKTSMEGLSKPFEMVNVAMMTLATVAAGFGLGEMIKDVLDASNQVRNLKATFGGTTEEAERTRAELTHLGISTETYTTAALKLDRQLKTNEAGLHAIGVATRDSNGNLLDQRTLLSNALQTMQSYKEGTDRNAAAQMMFGRSAAEVYPLLRMTGETAAQAAKDVKELGLSMDPAVSRNYQQAMGEMSLTFEGIKTKIAEAVLPALTDFATWFRDNGPAAIRFTQGVIDGLVTFFRDDLVPIFDAVRAGWEHLGSVVVSSLGGWESTKSIIGGIATVIRDVLIVAITGTSFYLSACVIGMKSGWEAIKEIVSSNVEYIKTEIGSWATIMADVAEGNWSQAKKDYQKGAEDVANIMRQYRTVMGQIGTDWAKNQAQNFKDTIGSMWAQGGIFGAPAAPKTNRPSATTQPAEGSRHFLAPDKPDEAIKAAEEEAKAHERVTQIEIQDKEQAVQQMRALDQISVADEIAQLTALENQRYDLIHAELQKELELVGDKPVEHAKVNGQIEVAEAQHQAKLNEIARKGVWEQVSYLKQAWAPITDTFNSAFESMLKGQATFWGAMKKGLQDFLREAIMSNLKRVESWILTDTAMTKSTIYGIDTRNAAGAAEGKGGLLAHIANALKNIEADAAQAFADVFAWASPEMGPFAIIPATAAAAVVGGASAFLPSFDVGAWDLPSDMIAQVHKGEMIVPADAAASIRSGGTSAPAPSLGAPAGGSKGGDTHVHIHAWDGRDALRAIKRHPEALVAGAKVAQNQLKLPRAYAV